MTSNKVLEILRKYSPVFNLTLGLGFWLLVRFAFSKIFENDLLKQNILLSSLYLAFFVLYLFIAKKIGTIQILGFQRKNLAKATIFMIPVVLIGTAIVIFTLTSSNRLGVAYSTQSLKENSLGILTGFLETTFLQEVFIVGFLSALHHRYSKTQWNAVILAVLVSIALCAAQFFLGTGSDYKRVLFQLFINIVIALSWLKYRNQIIFLIYFLAANCYVTLLLSMNVSGMQIMVADKIFSNQVENSILTGIFVFAAEVIFMILTLKFPIPKRKITYSKEISNGEESRIENVVVSNDEIKNR